MEDHSGMLLAKYWREGESRLYEVAKGYHAATLHYLWQPL